MSDPGEILIPKTYDLVRCGFCGKDQSEVEAIIVGATSTICFECVEIASRIVAEEKSFEPGPIQDDKERKEVNEREE